MRYLIWVLGVEAETGEGEGWKGMRERGGCGWRGRDGARAKKERKKNLPLPVSLSQKPKNAQVVPRQDQVVLHPFPHRLLKQPQVLAHRVRRALEPLL
jgi:hypothetical protein